MSPRLMGFFIWLTMIIERDQYMAGYPKDDEYSIVRNDGGECNLEHCYRYQYIQNEIVAEASSSAVETIYSPLRHEPVLTLTATVLCGGKFIQCFTIEDGKFVSYAVENSRHAAKGVNYCGCLADRGEINLVTREISLFWTQVPGKTSLIVSYEYEYDYYDKDRLI